RNNIREIFAADYYTWINYEAKGLTRLNKVAREIFFKHCPFAKPIRQNMANHPLFNQYITRFESAQLKHSKVIHARYSKLLKNFTIVDKDLADNLSYYEM
ncbi:MAG: hypothetical protein PHC92_06865, partial [Syntrophomonadaceae bacterium]|nr:hypothetical protein [Syntrophomonadaceae bacterium]